MISLYTSNDFTRKAIFDGSSFDRLSSGHQRIVSLKYTLIVQNLVLNYETDDSAPRTTSGGVAAGAIFSQNFFVTI